MTAIRFGKDRGRASFGWLDSRHTFSFGHYYDPEHMGYGPLRVINEDRVQPAKGFGTHGHNDMEILSFVLDGELEHKDSMGNGSVIRPGDVQRMTAGTGVQHSEFNASDSELVHFLQIWVLPEQNGLQPGYEQKTFTKADKLDQFRLIGSRDGREGSVTIHQDVSLYASVLSGESTLSHQLDTGRRGWLQVARGQVSLNGQELEAGDGVALQGPMSFEVSGSENAELLFFDMA